MTTHKLLTYPLLLAALLAPVASCMSQDHGQDYDLENTDDTKADGATTAPQVTDDQLNGIWLVSTDGQDGERATMIESWSAIGIQLHDGATVTPLVRSADTLTGDGITLTVHPNKAGIRDDELEGTIGGQTVTLRRDTKVKAPITVAFPGNEPYRAWLEDTILPLAQQDRESFKRFSHSQVYAFLSRCELYKHGSWFREYMKGSTWAEQSKSFSNIIYAMDHQTTTPHAIVGNYKFQTAVKANLKDPTKIGLALSSLGMYFSTAAGGALRFPIASDSTAYFITDRPARAELLGLVVMDTPTHGPLASTFGRQLLDLGAMPASDDPTYARTMLELLAKTDNSRAEQLSPTGRSALTDWFSVMTIEDYRGVAFGYPTLGWGYNMTNVQFYGLVVRSLARPGMTDSTGQPIAGQVIVGNTLEPGDPSYADVLNGGNDMQEYPDMARLKQLATQFLVQYHPDVVNNVYSAFATIIPLDQADYRAQQDIFHYITAQFYAPQSRGLTGATADQAIAAVAALFDTLDADSANFQAFILANGITQATTPAPKSTGF